MIRIAGTFSILALAAIGFSGPLHADGHAAKADCSVDKAGYDLTPQEAHEVYRCLGDQLYIGYNTGDKRWVDAGTVKNYRYWTPASNWPAAPGFHSDRFLYTYVNKAGADTYTDYPEGVRMPTGTILAKESFSVDDDGKAKPGPLFIMEKVAEGKSPKTNDWYYTAVAANGTPMGVNVFTACNECHSGFAETDFLGYPVEEVRRPK